MVKALHAADIEVILDVVYKPHRRGQRIRPDAVLRGIDNAAYYLPRRRRQGALLRHDRHRQQPAGCATRTCSS